MVGTRQKKPAYIVPDPAVNVIGDPFDVVATENVPALFGAELM